MFRPLPAALALATALATPLATPLCAQDSFAELQQKFRSEARELGAKMPTREQQDALLTRHIGELSAFVTRAQGNDRWNGRLMLADLLLIRGERDKAKEALGGIDEKQAPALLLVSAAAMAPHAGLPQLRERWINLAMEREAPLEDRLAIARLLTLSLHEIDRGEMVFQKELAAAKDDETRALIRFHRADTMRDREDLADNAGWEELERVAKDLPGTYWGSVARDRMRAVQLRPNDAAIPFTAKTTDGKQVSLAGAAGKVLVLVFWVVDDHDNAALWTELRALRKKHGEKLEVLAVNLDRELPMVTKAITEQDIDVPVIADGKGIFNDVALRWFVEGPGVYVVGPTGKVEGLRLFVGTNDGRRELEDAITRAVPK
ncbi:MAG: redoxin domain-containing protein [Planctomycetes bacterium]|nr:redoxin domain-containing protein [Planctomycetota bacterium]